jgi:uroporphyrinogen-III synthase
MTKLFGKRIALTGPRRAGDLGVLVEKLGGIPLFRPAQSTTFLEDKHVETEIRILINEDIDWVIMTTGIGIETLVRIAASIGLKEQLIEKFKQVKIAARGYKAVNALKKLDLNVTAQDDDGTCAGLVRALCEHDLRGCRVALQLHGDPAPKIVNFLQEQEAEFREILPYRHVPPDPQILSNLVAEILNGDIDAVTFTSGPQVRAIFAYAAEHDLLSPLLAAFEGPTVAVSVGKFTAEVIHEAGVARVVVPDDERMGGMIVALTDYYNQ